jgi:chemotaxis signal transduction protein
MAAPFQSTPATVDQKARALIMGAYTLPDQLLLALDARKVLADLAVTIG